MDTCKKTTNQIYYIIYGSPFETSRCFFWELHQMQKPSPAAATSPRTAPKANAFSAGKTGPATVPEAEHGKVIAILENPHQNGRLCHWGHHHSCSTQIHYISEHHFSTQIEITQRLCHYNMFCVARTNITPFKLSVSPRTGAVCPYGFIEGFEVAGPKERQARFNDGQIYLASDPPKNQVVWSVWSSKQLDLDQNAWILKTTCNFSLVTRLVEFVCQHTWPWTGSSSSAPCCPKWFGSNGSAAAAALGSPQSKPKTPALHRWSQTLGAPRYSANIMKFQTNWTVHHLFPSCFVELTGPFLLVTLSIYNPYIFGFRPNKNDGESRASIASHLSSGKAWKRPRLRQDIIQNTWQFRKAP